MRRASSAALEIRRCEAETEENIVQTIHRAYEAGVCGGKSTHLRFEALYLYSEFKYKQILYMGRKYEHLPTF